MGIDGTNYLEIRGSKEILDELEQSGLTLKGSNVSAECKKIAETFFGIGKIRVIERKPKYLMVRYEFRNYPVYEYLNALLERYPSSWIKNTFSTETGARGLWIGRFSKGAPLIQEYEWRELTDDEIVFVTDFSK